MFGITWRDRKRTWIREQIKVGDILTTTKTTKTVVGGTHHAPKIIQYMDC